MKKLIVASLAAILAIACIVPSLSNTNKQEVLEESEGINFIQQDFSAAIKKAKEENKLVFVDAYASWCGPCKMMDKKVFSNKDVAEYFNENFISVKIMIEDAHNVTPEGAEFAKRYDFEAYPTFFFIDKNGKIVKKIVGYHNKQQLLNEAKRVIK